MIEGICSVLGSIHHQMCLMTKRRLAAAAGLIGLLLVLGPTAGGAQALGRTKPVATGVRIGEHVGSVTRFVIDLSASVEHEVFLLADPYRVVVDLPEMGWQIDAASRVVGGGLVRGFRFGAYQSGTSRLVLDVSRPVRLHRVFMLPPQGTSGYRFVIDLKPTDRAEFMRAVAGRTARLVPGDHPQRAAPPLPKRAERRVVVIDPGHGGADPGTIGTGGSYEKTIVLAVAKELRRRLLSRGRYKVVMTRDRDVFVRLRDRVRIGHEAGGALFVSLHADSIKQRKVRGATVYALSDQASDEEAAELAAKENKSDIIAGVDLGAHDEDVANILIDLAQRDAMNRSAEFARVLVPALRRSVRLHSKPLRAAGFRVLKAPDVPSVLIEMGYLSNRQDEKFLGSKEGRAKMASAIALAIDRYFQMLAGNSR